jgi:mannose-6-phosphate isomerase-like protein (cupin superfamily)
MASPHPPLALQQDCLLFALSGEISVHLGTEPARLEPRSLMRIPKGVPHSISNARDVEASWIEIQGPAKPSSGPETSGQSGAKAGLQPLIRKAEFSNADAPGVGFEYTFLASRALGSEGIAVNVARVHPGRQGLDYHIHTFDQFYLVLKGRLTVDIGLHRHEVSAPSLVILPAGIVHRQRNGGPTIEEHLAIISPEPLDGERLDHQIAMPLATARGK